MSRLRRILAERYAEHYARVNYSVDPREVKRRLLKGMQRTYGRLVASLSAGSRVLDLGCGTGILLYWLSKRPGVVPAGVDNSPSQVELARSVLPGVDIHCADGLDYLRKNPDGFSGIFCTDVLEHIPSRDLCLEWVEAARAALRPGGFFFWRVPNAANLTAAYSRHMDLSHERIFTDTSILQLLEAAGLQDCRAGPFRAGGAAGRVRDAVAWLLHRIIFLACGQGRERIFTNTVCAVGFKREPASQ